MANGEKVSGVERGPWLPPLGVALGAAVGMGLTCRGRDATRGSMVAALIPTLASVALWSGSLEHFRRRGTTVNPYTADRSSELVTSGLNAVTRNPMYVGMASALVAVAVARRSFGSLLWVAGFVAVLDRRQITYEERHLSATFGDEYDAYRARVPRWL